MEAMWSFRSLDFEKKKKRSLDFEKFSEPTFVCRKPSIDFSSKRMVGSLREGQIHNSYSQVRPSWDILEWFEAAEAWAIISLNPEMRSRERRSGVSIEALEMIDHCLCPYIEVRMSGQEMALTTSKFHSVLDKVISPLQRAGYRVRTARHVCQGQPWVCLGVGIVFALNWPAPLENQEVWKQYPCGSLSPLSLMW